jgi:peptidoglycan/xylan/chitin deacetylase (PgdA/CDA1 family)
MSRALKQVLTWVGIAIFHLGLARAVIRGSRQGVRVLLYHTLGPPAAPFTKGLDHPISLDRFELHIDFVTKHYRPITLADLESGAVPQRALLVTFDDGFRSLISHALPTLRDRGILPTVFLIGRVVGGQELPWTHELAWAIHERPERARDIIRDACPTADRESIRRLLHDLWSSLSGREIDRLLHRLRSELGYQPEEVARASRLYLDWDEIAALRAEGWSFGSHTARHFSLAGMRPEEQKSEIREGIELIADRLGPTTAFAYPFGERDENARASALAAGAACLMEMGGVNPHPVDLTRVGRVPAQEAKTPAALFAELEIVTPIKAWVRRVFG